MNEFEKLIKSRRSCRNYTDEMVPEDVLARILEAGTYAPSGMGRQSAIIIAVTNKEVRDKLAEINRTALNPNAKGDTFYGAPVVLVVLSRTDVTGTPVCDGSLVMQNLMLAAASEGVASCWIHRAKEEFESEYGKELLKTLGVEGEYVGVGNCILGYAKKKAPAAKPRKEDFIHYVR